MAPRISSLFCLIIIASVIDCRAGECLFGCFLRVPLAVCRRKTALHPSRTEMFLVGQPIMADPPPHPPLLFPLREWGPSPFMICPFLCLYSCHPEIPTHSISDSKRRMVKSFVKWLFWPETRVCAWPYDVDFPCPEPVHPRAIAMFWISFFILSPLNKIEFSRYPCLF